MTLKVFMPLKRTETWCTHPMPEMTTQFVDLTHHLATDSTDTGSPDIDDMTEHVVRHNSDRSGASDAIRWPPDTPTLFPWVIYRRGQ
ncbi:hypothetical protein, partial [Mycolicibacterium llatzerense]|uniref:hypothetical protein n=1 Tax=Mycolicibacterium llatzerense TaxID=280871 RepID=UPI0019550DFE